ncbi:MAG: adenylate/guanylate cyclase domain-containing protein [Planctomycetes bacterium]|nr:adenylate/guanylate cyclase domain-containing protein [Planctomycetota bacterium]
MIARRAQQAVLAGVVGLAAATLVGSDVVGDWERDVYDVFSRAGVESTRSENVALVMLDEASLDWGRGFYEQARAGGASGLAGNEFLFPWDRSAYDLLVQFCALGGARVLAFDVELAGPHPSGDEAGDATLGTSTRLQNEFGAPYVVHALNLESAAEQAREVVALGSLERACLAGAAIDVDGWRASGLPFARSDVGPYSNPVLPYRTILEAFDGGEEFLRLGAVTAQPDDDGVVRRARPFVVWDGLAFPSLGVAAALAYEEGAPDASGSGAPTLGAEGERLASSARLAVRDGMLLAPGVDLPLTSSGDLLLRFRDDGREDPSDPLAGRYPTYPAHRVLRSAMKALGLPGWEFPGGDAEGYFLDPSVFAGRIVFLGGNAAGLRDLKAVPVNKDYPGVKVHAAVAEALLDGRVVSRPPDLLRVLAAALLAACALLLTTSIRSQVVSSAAVLALAAAWTTLASLVFLRASVWVDVIGPVLGLGLAYSSGTTWQWFTAGRQSQQITSLFQHFAPPAVVKQLIARPQDLSLRGENREITVFFSDIRGFTALSNAPEMRNDPSRLTDHLNAYLSEMTAVITECGGTVDKYIGDAVVAIFGAPVPQADHAAAACRAALRCQERIAAFDAQAAERGLPPLVTRIGLCSGEATVGCVGSRDRYSYTAIGSTVNFASRMEGVNKAYGTLVLAAGSTRRAAGDAVRARLVDRVRVPGLVDEAEPLEAWELLPADAPDDASLRRFEQARELYVAGRFDEAAEAFAALGDDPPARVLYDRCRRLSADPPPPGWDGSHRLEGK